MKLAEFDRDALWALDGFTNCVSWLVIKCEMGRSTAFEKVRLAHELPRRPVVREAVLEGRITLSKARAVTRLGGLDDERDARFVAAASTATVPQLELRVNSWNRINGKDNPRNFDDHYGPRREPGFMDGLGRAVLEAPNDMIDRFFAIVDAYGQFVFHNGHHTLKLRPETKPETKPETNDESLMETFPQPAYGDDWTTSPPDNEPKRPASARRADLFLDLLEEVALINEDKIDPETASIGVTIQYEDLIEGSPLTLITTDYGSVISGEAVRRLACDAGIHRMVIRGVSEFLDIGRKSRTWTTAQRRAIRARHNHRCAAAGCNRRITQIHHLIWWEDGGVTSIDNGVPLCSSHHHLVHEGGWTISYNPRTGITRLEGPQGQVLETQVDVAYRAA